MRETWTRVIVVVAALVVAGCATQSEDETGPAAPAETAKEEPSVSEKLDRYAKVRLTADLGGLSDAQKKMIPILIDAADAMDAAFWRQAYGNRDALLASIDDPDVRAFVELNYGPWDRLDNDEPFVEGVGPKPPGANMFPADLTKQDFDAALAAAPEAKAQALRSLYTQVIRGEDGALVAVPYSEHFADEVARASSKLREAAALAEDPGLKRYLELRAEALVTDVYQPSDMAWMDMKDNVIDVVIGPIETYEEQICGCKAAFEAYVLAKDVAWSERLAKYAGLLPELQRQLPVPDDYKRESPGSDSDLNAYDVLYYAGDCNAGAKTIAINLPNDEEVQLEKGSRRLQLQNAMRAKFDEIVVPIARELMVDDQVEHVTFDAFFANVMFHEVAHGLGIKNLVEGEGTVADALAERHSALEEGKADVLGLYLVSKLAEMGELGDDVEMMDYYVTFMASVFRSIRFGAARAHGKANLIRFNFFEEMGAFTRGDDGKYRVHEEKMTEAMNTLAEKILVLQGDGDYEGAGELEARYAVMGEVLEGDLARLEDANVPVDIRLVQGMDVLRDQL